MAALTALLRAALQRGEVEVNVEAEVVAEAVEKVEAAARQKSWSVCVVRRWQRRRRRRMRSPSANGSRRSATLPEGT